MWLAVLVDDDGDVMGKLIVDCGLLTAAEGKRTRGRGAVGWLGLVGPHLSIPFRGENIALYYSPARCANLRAPIKNAQHFLRICLKNRMKIFFIF
jgi:hypothetical protein